MRMSLLKISVMIVVVFLSIGVLTSSASAATLNVLDGKLVGATGVDFGGGTFYDVMFKGGTFIDAFGSCNASTVFTFTSQERAKTASQALLDQVFLDTDAGFFDTDPSKTFGINGYNFAYAVTPYEVNALPGAGYLPITWYAYNSTLEHEDKISDTAYSWTPFFEIGYVAWALWSESSINPIPVPTTMLLLGSGLFCLVGLRRKFTKE